MELAENLCDEIILINEGSEIISGNISNILNMKKNSYYKVVFQQEIDESIFDTHMIESYQIIDKCSAEVDLATIEPADFIKSISSEYEIMEFKRLAPSLHSIFVSLVK